jgi:tRNA U38,U39,U40 pseudouridine synthase TruA
VEQQDSGSSWVPVSMATRHGNSYASSLVVTERAQSFLYHQVRLKVTWLVEVGSRRHEPSETAEVVASRSVSSIGAKMVPPYGLYLIDVTYNEEDLLDWKGLRSYRGGLDDGSD